MNIMVTGANGGYGNYALDYLKEFAPQANLYALVRSEEKGKQFKNKGINIRVADYKDRSSMINALKGIDRLLFVSTSSPGIQKNVVEAAQINQVQYIAYTSLYGLEHEKFGLEVNHRMTEELIKESGIPYTFLRNNWYVELIAPYVLTSVQTKKFLYYSTDAQLSWALKREYAEAGARVIADGNYDEVLELTGRPYTFKELGQAVEKIVAQTIDIQKVTRNELESYLAQIKISQVESMLAMSYQDYAEKGHNGESKANPSVFEQVLGHPLTSLSESFKELLQ
ncbi:NAD(P)H-binding protein [Paenibacillus sp. PsM32]|uniref:NAD(P)H-binding protein n=1 Tax=Paenibacillus sp. PsM32 TaxID=3030536 RepID=UPI00263BAD26|nr:NAD(P)H-binding protein [Paenibacillus sp. PsM32]MDN4618415.1 NAD(P)H-binding protein [Paenibacillus sp. PsM32]